MALVTACQAVGKISDKNKTFSSDSEPFTLNVLKLPLGTRTNSACPPGIPPYKWLKPNKAAGGGIIFLLIAAPGPVFVVSQADIRSC